MDLVVFPFPKHQVSAPLKDGTLRRRANLSAITEGLRPYELWKKQMVTKSESVTLGKNREIKLNYDQCPKSHLTSINGSPHVSDYRPVAQVYHGNFDIAVDPAH